MGWRERETKTVGRKKGNKREREGERERNKNFWKEERK